MSEMIVLLILCIIVVVVLTVVIFAQQRSHLAQLDLERRGREAEQDAWRSERRFLVDRCIAQHVGDVLALEREHSRAEAQQAVAETERAIRPLIEGLS